jgi:hypothetical protein
MAAVIPIRDNFRKGFYAALGKVVVAQGRVEYELKLALKSLLSKGFTIGMAEAESDSRFWKLCEKVKALATKKLPEPHQGAFIRQVGRAERLAKERNDHIHALWTSRPRGTALRIRPRLDTRTKTVLWDRSGLVRISDLNKLAARAHNLQRAINKTRRFKWPKLQP